MGRRPVTHNCDKHELCWASVRDWLEGMRDDDLADLVLADTDGDTCVMEGEECDAA